MTSLRAMVARCAMLGLLTGVGLGAPALAQPQPPPNREVTVQNETDLFLQELYLAPPNAADRGPDRLGNDTVAPGATYRARLGRTRDCVFNVTAVFQGGTEEQRPRVDVCRAPRLVFGDPALPTLDAAVANASQVALRELYARPAGEAADRQPERQAERPWGPDRLGAGTIQPNGRFALRLRARECRFDLRAVYDDDREEVKRGLDLCQARAVAFDRSGIPRPPTRRLVLANRHLAAVQQAYLSASTDADWGPDRLGAAILEQGGEATVEMQGECEADLRIVFPSGAAEERRAVNICDEPRIVLRPGWVVAARLDPGDDPGPDLPAPSGVSPNSLRLRNAGQLPVVEIYTGRRGGDRGEDRLGADTLPIGATIDIEPTEPEACAADLVAVFRDGREVLREGVDLCTGAEIEVR
ncbi:hypothetical protein [Falsiroseomonas sp. HW251]|uniref:hypothetical protein n=1 Tax=Falsiroseomonas sp. HW251 TaxID=3390998 RepID=UPI003D312703